MPALAAAGGTSATVAPHLVRYLMLVADERGVPFDDALRAGGLTREAVEAPALRVSFRQGRAVIEAAVDALGVPALGLVVGSRQPITSAGVLGLGWLASPTVADGVALGVRYQRLAGSMVHWAAERDGDLLTVVAQVHGDSGRVDEFLVDEGFASITRSARDAAGAGFRPHRVELARPAPSDPGPWTTVFGPDVAFGSARNAWVLAPEQWRRPVPTADRWTLALVRGLLDEQTAEVVDRQELVALLSARVEAALPEVLPLAAHARALAMSERTLRRRLADVATTYSDVVDEVRRRLVGRLVRHGDVPLAEVATRVGYTDERSLRRSVHRWYGRSPAALRRAP